MTQLRIATRSSAQARTQAENIGALIERMSPGISVEYVFVDTHGDVNQTTPLHQMGGQGVFVKEVQAAVLDGRADLAVHSAKDLPSTPADGLHIAAGNSPEVVHELHGTWRFSRCFGCGDRRPVEETVERVAAGDHDPRCLLCGGVMKRDVVLFGEPLDEETIGAAMVASEACDLFLAIGTSLGVTPAANTIARAKAAGARTVIINGQPTERDQYASASLRGDISELLPTLVFRAT